jgi:hypothetical protein
VAITVTELVETASTANATSYASASYAPTANRGLLAFIAATGTLAADTTFTGNGLTWGLEGQRGLGPGGQIYLYSALSGASPSSGTGTFDCTSDAATGAVIHVVEIGGCDLTDFVTQYAAGAVTTGNTPVGTFAGATAADCGVCAFLGNDTNPSGMTEPSGYTELMDTGYATPATGAHMAYHASPGSITTVTWGSVSSTGSWQIVEIKAASAVSTQLIRVVAGF